MAEALIDGERKRTGWDDEQATWATRLQTGFGSVFWRSSKAEKEGHYRELAQEIVDFVGAPMGAPAEVEWWAALLRARFGGLDFWSLSPPWKQFHCEGVVREIFLAKRLLQSEPECELSS